MGRILNPILVSFSLIILFAISTSFVSIIYAEIFEFNPEDYYESDKNPSEENPTNDEATQQQKSINAEDTDKENCINNQIESVLYSNSDLNSDSYYSSNFHFIKKFDRNGNLIGSWGTVGSKDGQFLHAHGITIDSQDNVYVSDAENCNIQKFDKNGNFITKWGTKGIGPGKFLQPESMAVDSMNNIYVAEYSGKNIQKFDSNGNFIKMWGKEGENIGEFKKPWGVSVDSKDNVYVSDQAVPRYKNLTVMVTL